MMTFIKHGVVVMLGSKYWIGNSPDHPSWCDDIRSAMISDPKYCKKPTDVTYANDPRIHDFDRARLVPIKITTIFEEEKP
jgi:hypothetical protein